MSELSRFQRQSHLLSRDENHRLKILKATSTYDNQVNKMKADQFRDWEKARRIAADIKEYVLNNLPSLLEEFEEKISSRGAKVLWARDKDEAQKYFLDIAKEHQAQSRQIKINDDRRNRF